MSGKRMAAIGLAAALGAAGVRAEDGAQWIEGTNASALALFRQVAGEQGNAVLSPWSIGTAMTMALVGAGGETAGEMAGVLALRPVLARLDEAQSEARAAQAGLADGERIAFTSAQGLALGARAELVTPAFVDRMRTRYGAEVFRSPDVGPINAWVSERTRTRIPRLLDELPEDTVCVLLNAVYFKGLWAEPFEARATREAPFRRAGAGPVRVPMMQRTGRYAVLDEDGAAVLALPYAGERAMLLVALPAEVDGLDGLVAALDAERVSRWIRGLGRPGHGEVEVRLPRFKIEADYRLRAPYRALGMRRAFSSREAQFPGMTGSDRPGLVWIDDVVHKAMIEVNEEGTEAAAVTGVVMQTTSLPPPPRPFHADRPFLFLLVDRTTGAILFLGRMDDPTAE